MYVVYCIRSPIESLKMIRPVRLLLSITSRTTSGHSWTNSSSWRVVWLTWDTISFRLCGMWTRRRHWQSKASNSWYVPCFHNFVHKQSPNQYCRSRTPSRARKRDTSSGDSSASFVRSPIFSRLIIILGIDFALQSLTMLVQVFVHIASPVRRSTHVSLDIR